MERLSSLDAVFLAIENRVSPMNIGSVSIFEGPAPSLQSTRAFVEAKIQLVPRCRQRVREALWNAARQVWIDDVNFNLDDHLHHASLPPEQHLALEQLVERVMAQPLDRSRALWEMWVVDGLAHDRWAIVSKVHHCMVDGIAGTDLLAAMMDRAASVEVPPSDGWIPDPEPSPIKIARFATAAAVGSAWILARRVVRMVFHFRSTWTRLHDFVAGAKGLWFQPSRRDSRLTGPIGPHRRWEHTCISLGDVATIRDCLGGTVNDVVLTAISRGFRELVNSRGESIDERTIMALVPVSIRAPDEHGHLDNRVAVTHALLPLGINDPLEAYAAIRKHLDDVKRSHEANASNVLLHVGDFTPQGVAAAVARAVVRGQRNLETIVTNVRGPQSPLYLCGSRMLEAYPFVPIAGRIRIAIALWSYCGTLYFGITGDRDAASDLAPLVLGINRGFESLLNAAGAAAN